MCGGRDFVNSKDRPSGSPPLQHLRRYLFCLDAMTWRLAQQTRYTLRRNTANMMKGLILVYLTRNNQGHRKKYFQERAKEKKQKKNEQ